MTVVHDSGVWVSALRFGGVPRQAILKTIGLDQLAISDFIEAEIYKIMQMNFDFTRQEIGAILNIFVENALRVKITHIVQDVCRDPEDDHVLECAMKSGAGVIVLGDKDVLTLGRWKAIEIVTPRQYLDEYSSGQIL